jgi:hypothetical protein
VPSPSADPIILQILQKLAEASATTINNDNGFYTNIRKASIEPISLVDEGEKDLFAIVFREETNDVTDTRRVMAQHEAVIAAHAFVLVDTADAYANAHRLRKDVERFLFSVTSITLSDANGKSLVRKIAFAGRTEIVPSEVAQGYLESVVRAAIEYRDTTPPVPGI